MTEAKVADQMGQMGLTGNVDTRSKKQGSIAKVSLEKSINPRSVITIPAGTRIQIVLSRDIYLRKKD